MPDEIRDESKHAGSVHCGSNVWKLQRFTIYDCALFYFRSSTLTLTAYDSQVIDKEEKYFVVTYKITKVISDFGVARSTLISLHLPTTSTVISLPLTEFPF